MRAAAAVVGRLVVGGTVRVMVRLGALRCLSGLGGLLGWVWVGWVLGLKAGGAESGLVVSGGRLALGRGAREGNAMSGVEGDGQQSAAQVPKEPLVKFRSK